MSLFVNQGDGTGGDGADQFVYMAKGQGGDRIEDFSSQFDEIVVSAKGFKAGLTAGVLPSSRFALGTVNDPQDRFIYHRNQGKLWFDPDGTGVKKALLIATLDNQPSLIATDFSLSCRI